MVSGTNLTGKVLSATTTAMNSATPSGYGSTSEFSQAKSITVFGAAVASPNGSLADTGDKPRFFYLSTATLLVSTAFAIHYSKKRNEYSLQTNRWQSMRLAIPIVNTLQCLRVDQNNVSCCYNDGNAKNNFN